MLILGFQRNNSIKQTYRLFVCDSFLRKLDYFLILTSIYPVTLELIIEIDTITKKQNREVIK